MCVWVYGSADIYRHIYGSLCCTLEANKDCKSVIFSKKIYKNWELRVYRPFLQTTKGWNVSGNQKPRQSQVSTPWLSLLFSSHFGRLEETAFTKNPGELPWAQDFFLRSPPPLETEQRTHEAKHMSNAFLTDKLSKTTGRKGKLQRDLVNTSPTNCVSLVWILIQTKYQEIKLTLVRQSEMWALT